MSWTQKYRARLIAGSYRQWTRPGQKVLDVGCGNAEVSEALKNILDIDIHGTDISDYRKYEIPFRLMDSAERLPFGNDTFDVVMFNDVLHHSDNVVSLLKEGRRVATQILVFEDKESKFLRFFDVMMNNFYCSDMPCPAAFLSQAEWKACFRNQELTVQDGLVRTPFWYPIGHFTFCLQPGANIIASRGTNAG